MRNICPVWSTFYMRFQLSCHARLADPSSNLGVRSRPRTILVDGGSSLARLSFSLANVPSHVIIQGVKWFELSGFVL